MKKTFSTFFQSLLPFMVLGLSNNTSAALPKMEAPSRGEGTGIMATIQNMGFDGFTLAGLFIAAAAFLIVAYVLVEGLLDVRSGKKKMGDLTGLALFGIILIVIILWLINKAVNIL